MCCNHSTTIHYISMVVTSPFIRPETTSVFLRLWELSFSDPVVWCMLERWMSNPGRVDTCCYIIIWAYLNGGCENRHILWPRPCSPSYAELGLEICSERTSPHPGAPSYSLIHTHSQREGQALVLGAYSVSSGGTVQITGAEPAM